MPIYPSFSSISLICTYKRKASFVALALSFVITLSINKEGFIVATRLMIIAIERLQKLSLTWRGVRKDASTFIHNCPCCQRMSKAKALTQTTPFALAHYRPMSRVCVDAIGPLNVEEQKAQRVFVAIVAFSRHVKLFLLESISSEETLKAFNLWIADFGCPSERSAARGVV